MDEVGRKIFGFWAPVLAGLFLFRGDVSYQSLLKIFLKERL